MGYKTDESFMRLQVTIYMTLTGPGLQRPGYVATEKMDDRRAAEEQFREMDGFHAH